MGKGHANSWTGRRVLVTGGGGFIGSHLVRALISEGARVIITTTKGGIPWRLAEDGGRFELAHLALPDAPGVEVVFSRVQPDCVFHLSAKIKSPDPLSEFMAVNRDGVEQILAASVRHGVQSFVTLGSSDEYGSIQTPWRENAVGTPANAYSISKLAATELLAHAKPGRLTTTVARPSVVYGPTQVFSRTVPRWIRASISHAPLRLPNQEQWADYIFVNDLVEGLLAAGKRNGTFEIINFSSGRADSARDVAYAIAKEVGYGEPREELFDDGPSRTRLMSIEKAKVLLGWTAQTSLAEGLHETVAWYRSHEEDFSKLEVQ